MLHRLTVAVLLGAAAGSPLAGQDTTLNQAVRIGLTYDPGTKPGVLVLHVAGAMGDSVRAILQRDLTYGDRINIVAQDGIGFPEAPTGGRNGNYPVYQKLGAVALIQATATASGLHVAVHDAVQGQVERTKDLPLSGAPGSAEWRMSLHGVSDELEQWIVGVRGIAATRIAYVGSDKRVWVMDSDGANPQVVSEGGGTLAPAWHPAGRHLAYTVFTPTGTRIAIKELGGAQRLLAASAGSMNVTPTFSPDGSTIVYSHAEERGADLFAAPALESGAARRITVGRGSDNVSPTFSSDGRRIAFTTGRSGNPEIYISDADGTNPEILTLYGFGDQKYRANPDWSPDGRVIAFQSQIDGRFQIMTIALRDRNVKQLTSDGQNEDPSWAPDSRHLVFSSTRLGAKHLFVLDTETGNVRQLTRGAGARTPAWSPPLIKR